MLKEHIDRDSSVVIQVTVFNSYCREKPEMDFEKMNFANTDPSSLKLQNSDILKDLDQKLWQLDPVKLHELK